MAPQDLAACYPLDDPAATLAAVGESVGRAAGGTSGGLYHVLFAAAAASLARCLALCTAACRYRAVAAWCPAVQQSWAAVTSSAFSVRPSERTGCKRPAPAGSCTDGIHRPHGRL